MLVNRGSSIKIPYLFNSSQNSKGVIKPLLVLSIELKIPLIITATDLMSGKPLIYSAGSVLDAVVKSASIPEDLRSNIVKTDGIFQKEIRRIVGIFE